MREEKCPPAEELKAYALGKLRIDKIDQVADHVEACPPCEDTVAALEIEGDTVVTGLRSRATSRVEADQDFERAMSFVKQIGQEATIGDAASPGSPAASPPIGQLREYELLEKLGEGGMGAVYKARHGKLDKIVAIKVLPADKMKAPQAVARFEREMRAVGKLEHPNIVRAMDAGEVDGMHFLVMEYVKGLDLSQISKQHGPLPVAEACELIRQAAIGLDEAYDHDMVHRDIKPSNLILAQRRKKPPVVKILDMGLALLSDAHLPDSEGLTNTGQTMGTLDYMAPEQGGDSKNVDIRADIYALGATLYRLLCGEVIYHGEQYQSPVQKMMALAVEPAPAIQGRVDGIPDELAAIVHRLLEKNPDARFATPQEVADALAPFCSGADLNWLLTDERKDHPAIESALSATDLGVSSSEVDTDINVEQPGMSEFPFYSTPPTSPPTPPKKPHTAETPQPLAGSSWSGIAKTLVVMAFVLGGPSLIYMAVSSMVFYFQTPHGTLRIEIDDPDIEVKVKGQDVVLTNADKEPIKLKAGEHTLIVTRGDFTFQTKQFTLTKGKTTTVKIELLPGKVQVVNAGEVIGEKPLDDASSLNAEDFALSFDGEGDYVQIPLDTSDVNGRLTIEFMLDADTDLREGYTWLAVLDAGSRIEGGFLKEKGGQEIALFRREDKSGWHDHFPVSSAPRLHGHIAFVWDGKRINVYVNGKGTGNAHLNPLDSKVTKEESAAALFLGARGVDMSNKLDHFLRGRMDELRISNTARYQSEFAPPARDQRFTPDEHTLALYHFDEGSGDVLRDSSGNGHHGKVVGAKWVQGRREQSLENMALEFDGDASTNGYVVIPAKSMPRNTPQTIEAFVYLRREYEAAPKNWYIWGWSRQPALDLLQTSGKKNEYWRLWAFRTEDGVQKRSNYLGVQPGVNHVAIVWHENGKATCFVNGVANAIDDVREEFQPPHEPSEFNDLILGGQRVQNREGPGFFDGRLDELRISSVERYTTDFSPPDPRERFTPDEDTVALYHFDEGSGDVLRDSSGNGHHGKIVGAKWVKVDSVEESLPAALAFESSGQVTLPGITVRPEQNLTIEAWVQFQTTGKVGRVKIFGAGEISTSPMFISAEGSDSNYNWRFDGDPHILTKIAAAPADNEPGEWTHIAAVRKGRNSRLYVNGQKVGEGFFQSNRLKPIGDFAIGGNGFTGSVREVRITNGERYEEDFTPADRHQPDENTIALYHFDEGSGDVLRDSSGNGHHGKIVGAQWVRVEGGEASDPDRRAALWAIGVGGGKVMIDGQWIDKPELLPDERFAVEEIDISSCSVTDGAFASLAGLSRIRVLKMNALNVGDGALEHIAKLESLVEIHAAGGSNSRPHFTDAGVGKIASLPKLRVIYIHAPSLSDESLRQLLDRPPEARLRRLSIQGDGITDEGLSVLSTQSQLEVFDLASSQISDEAFAHITQLPSLTELVLSGPKMTGTGLAKLGDRPKLRALVLWNCPVTDDALRSLSQFPALSLLGLDETSVTDEGLDSVIPLRIANLSLVRTKVTDAGLAKIAAGMPRLQSLNLDGAAAVTDEGLSHVVGMKALRDIRVHETRVTVLGVARLQKARPDCVVKSSFTDEEIAAAMAKLPDSSSLPDSPDRAAAEWIISISRPTNYIKIRQDGEERIIKDPALREFTLPDGPFELTGVCLKYNEELTDDDLARLSACEHLEVIDLGYTSLTDEGMAHLKNCSAGLKKLTLAGGGITDTGLANFRDCRELTHLVLHGVDATTAGLENFKHCQKLQFLFLGGRSSEDNSLASFAGCAELEHLDVRNSGISGAELAHFKNCTKLKHVDLNRARSLGKAELAHLHDCQELTWVNVGETDIDDAALKFLHDCPKLTYLNIAETEVSDEFVKALQKSLPECQITREKLW